MISFKTGFPCISILLLLLLFACDGGSKLPGAVSVPLDRDWTIMVYMNGDNDLETQALADLNEMEAALSLSGLEVIVLIDRTAGYDSGLEDWTGTRLYRIFPDSRADGYSLVSRRLACASLGLTNQGDNEELNLGAPEILSSFISFASREYPAEHTMLVIWGHGAGWRSGEKGVEGFNPLYSDSSSEISDFSSETGTYRACSFDDTDEDFLYTSELGQALRQNPVDVIAFDTCSAALLEVAYEIREGARWMAGSEDLIPARGWNYQTFLSLLSSSGGTPEGAFSAMTESFTAEYAGQTGAAFSVLDLSLIEPVFLELNAFAERAEAVALLSGNPLGWYDNMKETIFTRVEDFYTTPGDLNIDLGDLGLVVEGAGSPLKAAVDRAVVYNFASENGNPRATGLAVHFVPLGDTGRILPHDDGYFRDRTAGNSLAFVSDSLWCPDGEEGTGLLYRLFYE